MKRWDWGSFWLGVMLTLLFLIIVFGAYDTGRSRGWQDASRVVGCSEGTKIRDVPDYPSSFDDQTLMRFVCEDTHKR